MTRLYLRQRVRTLLNDMKGERFPDSYINDMLNEGLKSLCHRVLLLESKDSSLTYSSTYDGFALPSDFIKVKSLQWESTDNYNVVLEPNSLEYIYNKRNDYKTISEEEAGSLNPAVYTIHNGYIIIDSTTQTSPVLYYYKYDTALSLDTSEPSIDSEYHKYLVDYAVYNLDPGNIDARSRWNYGIRDMIGGKKQTNRIRANYQAL